MVVTFTMIRTDVTILGLVVIIVTSPHYVIL
nr:MAG TPA: hypothetical protein [Caudoviricetes sp.]